MPLSRDAILACIPHQGAMCLWDTVQEWDQRQIVLSSTTQRQATHPLRQANQLHSVILCEYAAQAMAVHGGLMAQAEQSPVLAGRLAALHDVQLSVDRIDTLEGLLYCHAACLARNGLSASYIFELSHSGDRLAAGRATVHFSEEGDHRSPPRIDTR